MVQGRHRRANSEVVDYPALRQWNIEVAADENSLPLHVHIGYRPQIHAENPIRVRFRTMLKRGGVGGSMFSREDGFTLVEQMVTLVILGLLAAITMPAVLRQREKAWIAQTQSALKDASTSAFAWGNDNGGNFDGLDDVDDLEEQGYRQTDNIAITVSGSATSYCILALHLQLGPSHEWKLASYSSDTQAADPSDACP